MTSLIPLDELHQIMTEWQAGHVSTENRSRLKTEWLRMLGQTECPTCPDKWQDIFFHFRAYLLENDKPIMAKSRKYLVAGDGPLRLPFSNVMLVNDGQETETVKVINDKLAKEVLDKYPELEGSAIVKNPDYQPASKKKANTGDSSAADEQDGEDEGSDGEQDGEGTNP